MLPRLGPLSAVGDHWVVGDPEPPGATCIELGRAGVAVRRDGETSVRIPWPRVMELDLQVQPGRLANTRGFARFSRLLLNLGGAAPSVGLGPARLTASLRSPYEYWGAEFTRHRQGYRRRETVAAAELVRQVVGERPADRFGRPGWAAAVLTEAAAVRARPRASVVDRIGEILRTGPRPGA
ncbi:hypothetical protein [Kitasatospora sp. KL5]|uniref:hypothetical protein n=1 Tax=Kitasatospora sp. KL5 TaxID=3425125 RepID=UPI003D6E4DAD